MCESISEHFSSVQFLSFCVLIIPQCLKSSKDRNGMDLKKQKILRRGGKNMQKNCTKKIFMTHIIMMV